MRLLVIIYIAFIGLGLPDSLFGTAWPAIYADLQLPFSYGSFVTTLVFFGTMISSMFSAKLINRFGTGKVAAVSTLLTAIAMLGYSFVPNYIFLLLCALPLGLGAGAIDTSLNNYIAVHYSAKHMNFLHCFYGIGITVSPIILAKTMEAASGWRNGYRIAFAIQILITLLLFVTLPWWRKRGHNQEDNEEQVLVLSLKEIMATPGIKLIWILFVATCAIECTCGTWGALWPAFFRNGCVYIGFVIFPYVIAISIVIMAIAFGLLYFRMISSKKEASEFTVYVLGMDRIRMNMSICKKTD